MDKPKKFTDDFMAAAAKTLSHPTARIDVPPCAENYTPDIYDGYVDGELPQEVSMPDFEKHLEGCLHCQYHLKQAYLRNDQIGRSTLMSEIGRRRSLSTTLNQLNALQKEKKIERRQRGTYLLAASAEYEGTTGTAYGLAVDRDARSGSKMECFAWVGSRNTVEPFLDLRGPEVRAVKKEDTKYTWDPPLDRLEKELEELFKVNSLFKKLGLGRREITVDIRQSVEDAIIKEAHSLGLAVLVSILSALAGKKDLAQIAFSAGIRKNGELTRVGDLSQKLTVARESGVSELIISSDHAEEIANFGADTENLKIKPFSNLSEVLEYLGFFEALQRHFAKRKQPLPPMQDAVLAQTYFRTIERPDECRFVLNAACGKGLNTVLAREICGLAEDLCVIRHEQRPISTALVVGDLSKIENILPPSPIKFQQSWHIFASPEILIKLSSIVDGHAMGFVADHGGRIQSIRKLNIELTGAFPVNRLLTGLNRRYAILSKMTDALIFFMTSLDNTVKVFIGGALLGRFKNGKWVSTDLNQFENLLQEAASRKGILPEVIERIGRASLRMSDMNAGGLFVLFRDPADMDKRYSNLLNGLSVSLAVESIRELTDEELVNFAKEDGAVLVDRNGNIHSFMAFLMPDNEFLIKSEPSKGARHNVAKIISKEIGCICIVNSQDGGITVYEDGEQILNL